MSQDAAEPKAIKPEENESVPKAAKALAGKSTEEADAQESGGEQEEEEADTGTPEGSTSTKPKKKKKKRNKVKSALTGGILNSDGSSVDATKLPSGVVAEMMKRNPQLSQELGSMDPSKAQEMLKKLNLNELLTGMVSLPR
jgi:hypothetical protein